VTIHYALGIPAGVHFFVKDLLTVRERLQNAINENITENVEVSFLTQNKIQLMMIHALWIES